LLKCRYENVSLGDCIVTVTAILNKARVLSDDQHFDETKEAKRGWI